MTTAIILNAVLCVIAFAVVLRLAWWGVQRAHPSEGGQGAHEEDARARPEQDRLAA